MADDGLDWRLELTSKVDGAVAMVHALTEVKKELHETDSVLKKTEDYFKDFGKAVASTFTGMLTAEAVWDSIKEGGKAIVELGSELMIAADAEKNLEISFDNLIGQSAREVTFDWLDKLAYQLPGTDQDLKRLTRSLVASGVPMTGLQSTLVGIEDISATTGDSVDEVTAAFERMMITGDLNNRMLMKLKMTEKEALAPLAKSLGKPIDVVKQMVTDHKIAGDELRKSVLNAFANKHGGELGGAALEAGNLPLEKIKDIKMGLEDLGKTALMQLGPDLAASFGEFAKELAPGGDLNKSITETLASLVGALKAVDWVGGVKTMVHFLKIGADWVHEMVDGMRIIDNFFDHKTNAAKAQTKIDEYVQSGGVLDEHGHIPAGYGAKAAPAARALEPWEEMQAARHARERAAQGLGAEGAFGPMQPPEWMRIGQAAGDGVKAGGASAARAGGKEIGDAVYGGTKEELDIHSPSKKFAELGAYSAEGFAVGMRSRSGMVDAAINDVMMPAPSSYASSAGGGGDGQVSISMPITIQIERATKDTADEIADRLRAITPGMAQAFISQLRLQAGV